MVRNWDNNYRKYNYDNNNQNFSRKTHQNTRTQDNRSGKRWEQKEKDSKITLTQESSHFVPTKFSDSFFKQFNLCNEAEKRRTEEARQGTNGGK